MADPKAFFQTIVMSTRIRLARNFAAYPFPHKMDEAQAEDIVTLVREGLQQFDGFTEYNLTTLTEVEARKLQEKHLISATLLDSKGSAAFLSADECISIMVNEEDHLREQYICDGFELWKAYERISGIDEGLSSLYDFAFDEKLGFLTACPSNLGTGMRASVMMFLPALVLTGKIKTLLPAIKGAGMTLRGAFGEGTKAEGYVYQVSNERTLGWAETDVIKQTIQTTMTLCDEELLAREKLMKTDADDLRDRALRAYGVLTNCAILSETEFLSMMAEVRFGIALGFFETLDEKGFDDFITEMRSATFVLSNQLKGKRERYCDIMRAETVCNVLPELVRVVRKGR